MLRVLFPLIILICVTGLLLPALAPNQVLLPCQDLAFMSPWKAVMTPTGRQWNVLMWDSLAQFYPWRVFYHSALHNGQLPLWNPYQFCGAPLYANVQSAVFYPPNLLFFVMDPARALAISALLHLFLAGLFTYLLGRALGLSPAGATVSGIVYSLCAFNVTWLELPSFVNVATWLPLILLLSRQALLKSSIGAAVGAGIAVATALLAGHLQIAFYVILAAVVWSLWLSVCLSRSGSRRFATSIGLIALIMAVGAALAAVQLLPSIELGRLSHRAAAASITSYKGYIAYALPLMNMITAFVPDFFGNPSKNTFWGRGNYAEYAMYVGILPLVMAAASLVFSRRKEVIFFAVLAGAALLAALGTPLNAIFYFGIPGFSATGSPGRILVLYCFAISMLAGYGASAFTTEWRERMPKLRAKRLVTTVGVVGAVGVVFLAVGLYSRSVLMANCVFDAGQASVGMYGIFISAGLLCVAGAIMMWRSADMISPTSGAVLILAITVADLLLFGYRYNATTDRRMVYPPTPGTTFLSDLAGHERIMPLNDRWSLYETPAAVLPPNSSMVYRFRDVQGYDSLFPGQYKQFANNIQGMDSSPVENGNMVFFKQYANGAGRYARYIVSQENIDSPELEVVYDGEFLVYENHNAAPRAEIASSQPDSRDGSVEWLEDGLNHVKLKVQSRKQAQLILRDVYYPGWKAYVNSNPVDIQTVEQVFRSVRVPGGDNTVEFAFEPPSLRLGMYVSVLALAACIAACVVLLAGRGARTE